MERKENPFPSRFLQSLAHEEVWVVITALNPIRISASITSTCFRPCDLSLLSKLLRAFANIRPTLLPLPEKNAARIYGERSWLICTGIPKCGDIPWFSDEPEGKEDEGVHIYGFWCDVEIYDKDMRITCVAEMSHIFEIPTCLPVLRTTLLWHMKESPVERRMGAI